MELSMTECLICKENSFVNQTNNQEIVSFECLVCGNYSLNENEVDLINKTVARPEHRANLFGMMHEDRVKNNDVFKLTSEFAEKACSYSHPDIKKKSDKLLKFYANQLEEYQGQLIKLGEYPADHKSRGLWRRVSWSVNFNQLNYIINDYLLSNKLIKLDTNNISTFKAITILPKGYQYLEKLECLNTKSNTGFCAMWFDSSINKIWDIAIKLAICEAGYEARRIDEKHHNAKICDEILVDIKNAKFLIADLTGQRVNTYFEAGFALALKIPVIWTCKQSDKENLGFDISHYNFIFWEEDKLLVFKESLKNRILATIN